MKGNSLRADSAALTTVRTSSGYMEGTDNMEHFFLKGIHICLLGAVEFVAVKNAFAAAAGRTYITTGITGKELCCVRNESLRYPGCKSTG